MPSTLSEENPQWSDGLRERLLFHAQTEWPIRQAREMGDLVLYSSRDGLTWDEGIYLKMREAGAGAYSNSIVVNSPKPDSRTRLLLQASHAYKQSKTNVFHWWLDVTKPAK